MGPGGGGSHNHRHTTAPALTHTSHTEVPFWLQLPCVPATPAAPLHVPCLLVSCCQVVLYTVDGASLLPIVRGTLPGPEVLTTVDFGPTTDVAAAFALQRRCVCVCVGGCLWAAAATGDP